jgi:hypothetical protein
MSNVYRSRSASLRGELTSRSYFTALVAAGSVFWEYAATVLRTYDKRPPGKVFSCFIYWALRGLRIVSSSSSFPDYSWRTATLAVCPLEITAACGFSSAELIRRSFLRSIGPLQANAGIDSFRLEPEAVA